MACLNSRRTVGRRLDLFPVGRIHMRAGRDEMRWTSDSDLIGGCRSENSVLTLLMLRQRGSARSHKERRLVVEIVSARVRSRQGAHDHRANAGRAWDCYGLPGEAPEAL